MRFRAKLTNVELLAKVLHTLERTSKECIVHLTPKKVQFILSLEFAEGIQVWSGLNANTLFGEYHIESMNNNEISFQVNIDNLLRGLKSALQTNEVEMRLTKKGTAKFLCLSINQQTPYVKVIQDVPVNILSAQSLAQLTEPQLPDPEVHIMMPPLKSVRNVIDRMKNVAEYVVISANMAGLLKLSVETDMVTIATFYKNLEHPQIEGKSPPRPNPDQTAEVKVDIKKFARFLYSYQVNPTNVICCLVENRALVLHVLLDDLYMTYYLPVLLV